MRTAGLAGVSIQNTYWFHSHQFQCHCKQRGQVARWCAWQYNKTRTSLIHRSKPQTVPSDQHQLIRVTAITKQMSVCEQGCESHRECDTTSETNTEWLTICKRPTQHMCRIESPETSFHPNINFTLFIIHSVIAGWIKLQSLQAASSFVCVSAVVNKIGLFVLFVCFLMGSLTELWKVKKNCSKNKPTANGTKGDRIPKMTQSCSYHLFSQI